MTAQQRLSNARLYAILDLGYVQPNQIIPVAEALVSGGVDLIQLRAKNTPESDILRMATELRRSIPAVSNGGPLFIINDFPDIAAEVQADGVHVGQGDFNLVIARKTLANPQAIVGKSTHSLDQALEAVQEGADYIGVGPIFPTATKPDYQPVGLNLISTVAPQITIPYFCIGGIKLENVNSVLDAGARRVVIVSGILQSPDIAYYCQSVRAVLEKYPLSSSSSL